MNGKPAPPLDPRCGPAVLVVSSDPRMRRYLSAMLTPLVPLVESAGNIETADALLARCHFDLLVSAVRLSEKPVSAWVKELRGRGAATEVLFVAASNDRDYAADIMGDAQSCVLFEPFGAEQLLGAISRCAKRRKTPVARSERSSDLIVGDCPQIRQVRALVERVAPMRSTLLVEGATGTGKDVAARAIHALSGRSGSFVAVNCGALPQDLLESELFGHERGAFTGAHHARRGLIRHADGGTLFLDEISEMPIPMQAKLLRVLEDRCIRPVGSNDSVQVDVRVVAATNRELQKEVGAARFREDLFYRLNVVKLRMPTLKERPEDIPRLARHLLANLAEEMGLAVAVDVADAELEQLRQHDWPGNVRELRNVIERSLALGCPPSQCLRVTDADYPVDPNDLRLETMERRHIQAVLQHVDGNKSEAARRLGISRKTLERKLKRWAAQDCSAD